MTTEVNAAMIDIHEAIAADQVERKIAKGKALLAQQAAAEAQARYQFIKRHSGTAALQNNIVFYDCEANWQILHDFLRKHDLSAERLENLEKAFKECRAKKQLIEWDQPYQRKADSSKGIMPQVVRPTFPEPTPHVNLTRQEIIKMPKQKLRLLIKRGGAGVEAAINRILAGR